MLYIETELRRKPELFFGEKAAFLFCATHYLTAHKYSTNTLYIIHINTKCILMFRKQTASGGDRGSDLPGEGTTTGAAVGGGVDEGWTQSYALDNILDIL